MSEPESYCRVRELGVTEYLKVWEEMKAFTRNRTAETQDELWVLQHEPVFTLGQAGKNEHVLDPHNIPLVKTDRGGQVTYHGPGQLIIYFLLNVRRRAFGVRTLVDIIETSIVALLNSYGIDGQVRKGAPGVYVEEKKIAALGLRIRNGCSLHGLSLNIDMDLTPFQYINPCGYAGLEVTQLCDLVPSKNPDLFNDAHKRLIGELQARLL
jgi:lipoyl(octanoyl) transferase